MGQITVQDVLQIIRNLDLDIDADGIDPKADLTAQGVDSLDLANLLFGIEEQYSINFPDDLSEDGEPLTLERLIEHANGLIGD